MTTAIVVVVVLVFIAVLVWAVADATRRPAHVWQASGHSQPGWIAAILIVPLFDVFYLVSLRPELASLQQSATTEPHGPPEPQLRADGQALLRVEDLVVEFAARGGQKVHAVSGVSLDILEGETLGLVGESGCGKSTTGRAIVQLPPPISGTVTLAGQELTKLGGTALRRLRPTMQMIFQDPISSLNPRRKVRDIVAEGLEIWSVGDKASRSAKVDEVLDAVGIDPANANRRPHEFSGGQCQRISIARAVVTEPKLIICDEPVSALDVSVQAQIINLLQDMKARYGLTLVFIAHDLAVVKNVSDRVMVMYLGKLCEVGVPDALYERPSHPYTAALLAAIPVPDPETKPDSEKVLGGEIPSPLSPPSGCRFRTRCPKAEAKCAQEEPQMREITPNHFAACHFPLEPGEALDFTKAGTGAFIGLEDGADEDDDV
jgi:peptide/nickel transport system ATP-binding protein